MRSLTKRDNPLQGQSLFIFTILVVGLSGIMAQVLLLRELLVSFYGNELTIGIILANWVAQEALGVFLIGKIIDRIKNKINVFIWLQLIFSLMFPVSIYLCRTFKYILGIPYGEAMGLFIIFLSSFFIILPLSFCHGALFSVSTKLYSIYFRDSTSPIGKVYALETIGTLFGAITLTYLLLPYLDSFGIAFSISFINLVISLVLLKDFPKAKLKYIVLASIILFIYLSLSGNLNRVQRISLNKQWQGRKLLDYRNSIYGNIAVTKEKEQYTFFYNGIPIITAPYPDKQFVQEFGHLPLLFHQAAKDILVISAGAGGLISEILKHPVEKIDYVELDPLIIEMLKKYPTSLTEAELKERRVNIINLDGRFYLRTNPNFYDIILIGMSNQADLSTNRLFTREFFSLVKKRLNSDGILSLWLPGSLTYISRELRGINFSILNSLKSVYNYVRIIPGDYNIFLASSSEDIMEVDSKLISQRIRQQDIKTDILIPNYLDYRLNKRWLDWFMQASSGATSQVNCDLKPIAVFQTLIFWNKKFSPNFAKILEYFQGLNLKLITICILITLFLLFIFRYFHKMKLVVAYSIFSTGFFGMLTSLILMFSFQVFYGYLYYRIAVLISIFMTGIALGSIFMTKNISKIKKELNLFVVLEVLVIVFSYIMALVITQFLLPKQYVSSIFILLFFVCGILIGLEFPLASKIYLGQKESVGETAGVLYGADLFGGWLAGILGGIILLPILGFFNSCMVMVLLKLSSLLLILTRIQKGSGAFL
jgi:spermidine synthase